MFDEQQHVGVCDRKDDSRGGGVADVAEGCDIAEDVVERIKVLSVVVRKRQ